jgi:hypothetical protein
MKKVIAVSLVLFVYAGFAFAGEKARDGRFIAYDNGTVLDTQTNLMWAEMDNGGDIRWANAKSYCENYRGGGYTDWRMPTQNELAGLYDEAKTDSDDGVRLTELILVTTSVVWASERSGSDAALFLFGTGGRNSNPQSCVNGIRALPVRFAK